MKLTTALSAWIVLQIDFYLQNKTHILYLAQHGPGASKGTPVPVVLRAHWRKGLSGWTAQTGSRLATRVNNEQRG